MSEATLCCFDIGGSKIAQAVVNEQLGVGQIQTKKTPLDDFNAFAQQLKHMTPEDAPAVAISTTGVINPITKTMNSAAIPAIHGRNLAAELTAVLGKPVHIANDAKVFALYEALRGRGAGYETVFVAIIGTGIGGAFVMHGRVLEGYTGSAGEWGHGPAAAMRTGAILPALQCGCGQLGCLNVLAGARGLEALHKHFHGITAISQDILSAWHDGESEAKETLDVFIDMLGGGLANVANAFDPPIMVLGGGLAGDERLVDALEEEVQNRKLQRSPERFLHAADQSIESSLIGAALSARNAEHAHHS